MRLLLAGSIVVGLARPAAAFQESARSTADAAQELAKAGDLDRAIASVEKALPASAADAASSALLHFTLGWLGERRAERNPELAAAALEEAAQNYRAALAARPGHAESTESLALVLARLDRAGEAIELLRTIASSGAPDRQAARWLLIGDLELRSNDGIERALAAYELADRTGPSAKDAAADRTVALIRNAPNSLLERLRLRCREFMKDGRLEAASRGFAELVPRTTTEESLELHRDAIAQFIRAEARRGALHPKSLDLLVAATGGEDSKLAELAALLADPKEKTLSGVTAWKQRGEGHEILGWLLVGLADHAESKGDVDRAAALLDLTNDWLGDLLRRPPEFDDTLVGLTIFQRIATLCHRYPRLDTGGRFAPIEELVMREKGARYLFYSENLPVILQFHTTLGMIYAERNAWDDSLHGALYHLRRAIDVAQQLARRDPKEYKPYPFLATKLAAGLLTHENPVEARRRMLDAAMGYLDEDSTDDAARALESALSLAERAGGEENQRQASLERLVHIRGAAQARERDAFQQLVGSDGTAVRELAKLGDGLPGVDPVFLHRQRLRTMADATTSALRFGLGDVARNYSTLYRDEMVSKPGATRRDLDFLFDAAGARPARWAGAVRVQSDPNAVLLDDSMRRATVEQLKRARG